MKIGVAMVGYICLDAFKAIPIFVSTNTGFETLLKIAFDSKITVSMYRIADDEDVFRRSTIYVSFSSIRVPF